jgi:hypothetical protein
MPVSPPVNRSAGKQTMEKKRSAVMTKHYYIASCVFTSRFPELSRRIQNYVEERFGYEIVRCCVPSYKLSFFEEKMPEGELRECWKALPDSGMFKEGDIV